MARSVLYPKIDTNDVWIDASSDRRYIVDKVDFIAEIKGVSLVGMLHLRLAPATDVVYSVPVEGTPPLTEEQAETCDVNKGLNATYEDW